MGIEFCEEGCNTKVAQFFVAIKQTLKISLNSFNESGSIVARDLGRDLFETPSQEMHPEKKMGT